MKKVLIYCASGAGERAAYTLNEDAYQVVGLVDSNPETWGKPLYGMGGVLAPHQIREQTYDRIIIAIPEYEKEIRRELTEKYGVPEEKIVVYMPEMRDIRWEEERIVMLRKCIALLKERGIAGDMAEVGVYTAEFSKIFNRHFPEQKLYLFDTFAGFDAARDSVKACDTGNFRDTSVEVVQSKMKNPANVIIRKGYFPDTAEGIDGRFSLVSLDCDLYNPMLAGLRFFYPKLVHGGYIFIHDFGSYHYEEVRRAVYDFDREQPVSIVPIVDRCLSVIITK